MRAILIVCVLVAGVPAVGVKVVRRDTLIPLRRSCARATLPMEQVRV